MISLKPRGNQETQMSNISHSQVLNKGRPVLGRPDLLYDFLETQRNPFTGEKRPIGGRARDCCPVSCFSCAPHLPPVSAAAANQSLRQMPPRGPPCLYGVPILIQIQVQIQTQMKLQRHKVDSITAPLFTNSISS